MNVFEDLIEELKEENLLEETVIDIERSKVRPLAIEEVPAETDPIADTEEDSFAFAESDEPGSDVQPDIVPDPIIESGEVTPDDDDDDVVEPAIADVPEIARSLNPRDFFRKRAVDEVSSMQMVEHVLSGVEREHMKVVPEPYDDLEAKKALHRFLQVTDDPQSAASAEAEYQLLQETQNWYSALAERDKAISVANIRRFCENSRPVLSSQALMALARFYRNSPFNESVRGKFDFVMTRLFAREVDSEKRLLLFGRKEMIGHIKTLYENWSSIELFTHEENQAEIAPVVAKFTHFAGEAEHSESLDALLKTDIFERIRVFKEDIGELFFAPEVAAAAIDCNVRVGNRFIDLIAAARGSQPVAEIEEKYGYSYDQLISNTTGKTLLLVDLLRGSDDLAAEMDEIDFTSAIPNTPAKQATKASSDRSSLKFELFGVNKWFLAATILILLVSVGVYVWADMFAGSQANAVVAKDIDISATELKQHLRMARATNETLYCVIEPSWDGLNEDAQKEFLKKVLDFAGKRGLKKVNLLNYKGRSVAYAAEDRLELLGPS